MEYKHPTECLRADKFEAISDTLVLVRESIKELHTEMKETNEALNTEIKKLNTEIQNLNYFKFKIIGISIASSIFISILLNLRFPN